MPTVDLGDPLPAFAFQVTDQAGDLADPVTFTVTLTGPDGALVPVSPMHAAPGLYTVAYIPTVPGRWVAVGTATGGGTDGSSTLVWDVDDTAAPSQPLISLDDIKAHLSIAKADQDDRLRTFALAASDRAEEYTGRTWRRQTVVEAHDGGGLTIALRRTPVQSVTAVTMFGSAVTSFVLDRAAGTISYGTTAGQWRWVPGRQNIIVTYIAGPTTVPANIRLGCLELVRHQWDTMRGGYSLPRTQGTSDDWDPRMGYSLPRRVTEMWDPYRAPRF